MQVPAHFVAFALHAAASNIVLLVEAHRALPLLRRALAFIVVRALPRATSLQDPDQLPEQVPRASGIHVHDGQGCFELGEDPLTVLAEGPAPLSLGQRRSRESFGEGGRSCHPKLRESRPIFRTEGRDSNLSALSDGGF